LNPDLKAKLAALQSPYAALSENGKDADISAGSTDIMVLQQGEPLRNRVRREIETYAGIYWPKAATWPSLSFPRFQHPKIDCPSGSPRDGEVCTLTFAPRQTITPDVPLASGALLQLSQKDIQLIGAMDLNAEAQRVGSLTVRFDIDDGGGEAFLRPPPDPRPLLAPGAPTSRLVTGDIDLAHLGRQSVVCRADASPERTWERRNCAVEYGPVRMTVGRDVYLPGAPTAVAAFAAAGDDPDMVADLKEAGPLLVEMARDPVLMRAFPPLRRGNNPDALMFTAATGEEALDDTAKVRELSANAPLLPWHDVINQREFDVLCADAAAKRRPLLIYTADGRGLVQSYIYDNEFKKFSSTATLVLVRMYPQKGDNAWAKAFAEGIGAGAWSALTVTDKPKRKNNSCDVGKVLQGGADEVRPVDVMRALVTGRPPPAARTPQKAG
jgi:hypothetical protein